jgi:hypothetical protein
MDGAVSVSARGRNSGTLAGFLAVAFCLVGLIGLFATYAAPLPYQREIRREQVLDQVLVTPPAQLPALEDALGESADAVLKGTAPLPQRVAAERVAMRARFADEADGTAERLRVLIVVITIMGALVGAVMLGLQRR